MVGPFQKGPLLPLVLTSGNLALLLSSLEFALILTGEVTVS